MGILLKKSGCRTSHKFEIYTRDGKKSLAGTINNKSD